MITLTPDNLLRRRTRTQTNYPTEAFALGENAVYLKSQVPEPEEEYLRYEPQELELLRDTEARKVFGQQVIMDETSSSRDVAQKLHALREERRHLYRQESLERKALRASTLAKARHMRPRWVKVPTTVTRPIYRVIGEPKLVEITVICRARRVVRTFFRRLPNGKVHRYPVLIRIQPRKRIKVMRYKRKRIQVGVKTITRNKRVKILVSTVNWARYRLMFGEALADLHSRYGTQVRSLQERILVLEKTLAARQGQPHALKTWTECGLAPAHLNPQSDPYTPREWMLLPDTVMRSITRTWRESAKDEYNAVSGLATGRRFAPNGAFWQLQWFLPILPVDWAKQPPIIEEVGSKGSLNELLSTVRSRMVAYEYPFSVQSTYEGDLGVALSFDERKALPEPTRVVDRSEGNGSLDRNAVLNASVRAAALIRRGDTQFRVLRSLLELKDTPELKRPGQQFLAFLASLRKGSEKLPSTLRLRRVTGIALNGLQLLAGVYLTKVMAIEPTISDIETCINESRRWILDARRSLTVLLDGLKKSKTNILHYRVSVTTPGSPRKDVATVEVEAGPRGHVELRQFVTVDKAYARVHALAAEDAGSNAVRLVETERLRPDLRENEREFDFAQEPVGRVIAKEPGAQPDLEVFPQDRIGEVQYLTENRAEASTVFTHSHVDSFQLGSVGWNYASPEPDVGSEQKAAALKLVTEAEWPRPEGAVYMMNRVTAVAFARYSVDVVREYASYLQSGSLTNIVEGLLKMESLEAAVQSVGTVTALNADEVRIAWDLTPLSFVFEWFSTVGDVIDRLNAFAEERVAPTPTSLDGLWATMRCDLLAGMPAVDITSFSADAQVMSWFVLAMRRKYPGVRDDGSDTTWDETVYAVPRKYSIRYKYTFQQRSGLVTLSRSGLYRAIRGMVTPTFGDIVTPHVNIRLSSGKLTSLVALLTSFLGGKR